MPHRLPGIDRLRALYRYDAGIVGPPSERAKRRHLLALFRAGGHRLLVESGTYLGDTVAFFLPHAERIISVEIEPRLYEAARRRFQAEPKVELHLGDALRLIPELLAGIEQSTLLWLDGHFTGGVNTIMGEQLEPAPSILERLDGLELPSPMTVVVDDLRLFGRGDGFPSLDALTGSARRAFPAAQIVAGLDSLVILA